MAHEAQDFLVIAGCISTSLLSFTLRLQLSLPKTHTDGNCKPEL